MFGEGRGARGGGGSIVLEPGSAAARIVIGATAIDS